MTESNEQQQTPVQPGAGTIPETDLFNEATNTINNGTTDAPNNAGTPGNTTNPTNTGTTAPVNKMPSLGDLVSGKHATELIDTVFPSVTVGVARFAGYDIDKREIQMTSNEKAICAMPMQAWLNTIPFDLNNPLLTMLATFAAIYSAKFIEKGDKFSKRIKKERKPAVTTDIEEIKSEAAIKKIKETPAEVLQANAMIKDVIKAKKVSRVKAIEWLIKMDKLPKNFKDVQQ
jgi:hypothetical protein